MKTKHFAARISELSPGQGIKVKIGKHLIAIFYYQGQYFAIQNFCPHQNADLADGYIRGGKLYCPLHNWAFDLASGTYAFNPDLKLKTYPLLIEEDSLYILLD